MIKLKCGCSFDKHWTFCNEAKRLLKMSQIDYKKRKDYDNHFKKLSNDIERDDMDILSSFNLGHL